MDPNSLLFITFQCILHDSGVLFSGFSNLYKLKREDLISAGNQFCRIPELFCPLFCISILKVFLDPNSSSFIRFQCFLYDSGVLLSGFSNLYKLKRGGSNFCGEPILQNVWIIWSRLLYLNFKSVLDPNSSPFISFQCSFYDSGVLLSGFSNLYKLKSGDLISGGTNFWECLDYLVPSSVFKS